MLAVDRTYLLIAMDRETFEAIAEEAFGLLPEKFRKAIDNVAIVVEDYPTDETIRKMHLRSKYQLLGLYQGVPLTMRGTWYGMTPTPPDRVTLYQRNIEAVSHSEESIKENIREVLIHEIGHYFGMSEEEIRKAGF